jgi:hypothetical protein
MVTQRLDGLLNAIVHVSHENSSYGRQFMELLSLLGAKVVSDSAFVNLQIECRNTEQLSTYLETLDHLKKFDDRLVYNVHVNHRPKARDLQQPNIAPCDIPNHLTRKRNSISDGISKLINSEAIAQLKQGTRLETTMMLRNIPNKYTPLMLQEFIEKSHKYLYDFFYLRMDFKNKCNVGYAFINFVTPHDLATFAELVQHKRWDKFNSEKVIATCFADIQGIDSLIQKFRNSRYC